MASNPFGAAQQQHTTTLSEQLPTSSGTATTSLLVRHLPEAVPHELLSRLFSYYGASSFRPCSGGRLRNCAFVDFKDEISASRAQLQLNRLRFHKKVLSVERASNAFSIHASQSGEKRPSPDLSQKLPKSEFPLNGTAGKGNEPNITSSSEPIAPRVGVDFPFPPHLEYDYPSPDGNILTNIVNALIAVPRFYTQVLHLMNKMNIPAPFRMALPTPPLPPPVPASSPPPPPSRVPPFSEESSPPDMSSDESELESSEEDVANPVRSQKRVKKEVILGPAVDKCIAHEDVGLQPSALIPKEVPIIKKKNPVLQIKIASKPTQNEKKDNGSNPMQMMEQPEHIESKPCATQQEIEHAKLPPEEILSLPMFKNYAAGNPATVLYIKNLAKDVIADDFYYIFGSLFDSYDAARSDLSVKLMQEGRMRGQAFVTFPSIDLSHRALNLVNGYVFKGKPMIIQFGRNQQQP